MWPSNYTDKNGELFLRHSVMFLTDISKFLGEKSLDVTKAPAVLWSSLSLFIYYATKAAQENTNTQT